MVPSSRDQVLRLIETLEACDIVVMLVPLSCESLWLYKALSRRHQPYVALRLGLLPSGQPRAAQTNWLDGWRWRIRRLRDTIRWTSAILRANAVPDRWSLTAPRWVLRGGRGESLPTYFPKPWKARGLKVHSFDVEKARYSPAASAVSPVAGDYAVFLDEGMTNHPDYDLVNVPRQVSPQRYGEAMGKLFTLVHQQFGWEVVIAGHPRINYEGSPLPGRVIQDATAPLVRGARLVLAHNSTSVSFAVLFRKPLLFITTDELERGIYRDWILRMALWFGLSPLNADHVDSRSHLAMPVVDEARWAAYEACFLREPDAPDRSIWDSLLSAWDHHDVGVGGAP